MPVTIVTGGAGAGIGCAVVRELHSRGHRVAVLDRNATAAEALAAELGDRAHAVPVDVADAVAIAAAVEDAARVLGPVTGLVNSAAVGALADIEAMDPQVWDTVHSVNLRGPFLVAQAAVRAMVRERVGGSLVHVGSVQGTRPGIGYAAYAAAKSGLLSLSRSLAVEYGRFGIRSNVVSPGLVDSPANRALVATREDPDDLVARFVQHEQLLPRAITPEDVANAVAFLLSDEGQSVTAAELVVDAGYLLGPAPDPPPAP